MNLIIKTLNDNGKIYEINDLQSTSSVLDLKKKLKVEHNIKFNSQLLVFGGTKLITQNLLSEFGICDNSIIYLCLRNETKLIKIEYENKIIINWNLPTETLILCIKKLLKKIKKLNLSNEQQQFIYNGKVLNDDATLSDYILNNEATIKLIKINHYDNNNKINIIIKYNNKEILINNFDQTNSILDLKKRIIAIILYQEKDYNLLLSKFDLNFIGELLNVDYTPFYYFIKNNSIVNFNVEYEIEILIKIEDEKEYLKLDNIKTTIYIHELKKLIHLKIINSKYYDNYHLAEIDLIYNNLKLDDNKIILFHKIDNQSIINLKRRSLKIKIVSLLDNERKVNYLNAKSTDTIAYLKYKIKNDFKIRFKQEELLIYDNGILTDNDNLLLDYLNDYNYKLTFFICKKLIKINIRYLRNILSIGIGSTNITVYELKQLLKNECSIASNQQRLFFRIDQELEDDYTLSHYLIDEDDFLRLCKRTNF